MAILLHLLSRMFFLFSIADKTICARLQVGTAHFGGRIAVLNGTRSSAVFIG